MNLIVRLRLCPSLMFFGPLCSWLWHPGCRRLFEGKTYIHISKLCLNVFQVFAWGCGSCLGCGSSETTSLRPRFIEDLSITKIIDISCGDSHCLALSHGKRDCVFLERMALLRGQPRWIHIRCGSPQRMRCTPGGTTPWDNVAKVTRRHPSPGPRKCLGWRGCRSSRSPPARLTAWPGPQFLLTGVHYPRENPNWYFQGCRLLSFHKLCHACLLPPRQLVAWHRPFCVDLEESTFSYLRNFLESYCDGIENETPPAPFLSKRLVCCISGIMF